MIHSHARQPARDLACKYRRKRITLSYTPVLALDHDRGYPAHDDKEDSYAEKCATSERSLEMLSPHWTALPFPKSAQRRVVSVHRTSNSERTQDYAVRFAWFDCHPPAKATAWRLASSQVRIAG
jgi:hypothetical protein